MINLTDDEREFLRGMRSITIDAEGQEIFVGLTADESEEYLPLSRRHEGGEDMTSEPRFAELHARHEQARQTIVAGKAPLDRFVHTTGGQDTITEFFSAGGDRIKTGGQRPTP